MSIATPSTRLLMGTLTLLLRHQLSHCAHSGLLAANLLQRLADSAGIDNETRQLCELVSCRLYQESPAAR